MAPPRKGGREALPANSGKKPRKEKRQLVRWDQELDTLLLLTVQSACNLTGVKVPWEKVAELMGPKFTEGAIVQHLSKLRIRREAAGQRVPPPLRRSVTAAAAAGGGGKGSLKSGKNARKRKGRSGVVDDDSSGGLDAQEEDDSDPEYIQNKRYKSRRFSFSTSKKSNVSLEDDDDDDALMCGGAPFLQHTQPDIETDQYNSDSDDSDEDATRDVDDDYDSDSYNVSKIKLEQGSPTPRQSRVVKLPVSLGNRGQSAMKSIRGLADATPPPSAMVRSRNQSYLTNDPAMMSNNPSMFVPQGTWTPSQMPTSQAPENMYHSGPTFWPQPTPVVNNQMLAHGEFIWSPHAPGFAAGHGGGLAVPSLPASTWDSTPATVDEPSAPSMDVKASNWFLNSIPFAQDDGDEAPDDFKLLKGGEEY